MVYLILVMFRPALRGFEMQTSCSAPVVISEVLAGDALSFADAARVVPSFRGGRPTHVATIWRWACKGVRLNNGSTIKLETCRCGGRHMTSRAALGRFIGAQTSVEASGLTRSTSTPTLDLSGRGAQHASQELDRMGL
jgi:hypothetical protein